MAAFPCSIVAIALCAILTAFAPASAAERFALLIGNSRYEAATPLRNPENDIEIVGAALEKSGFATTKAANLTMAATLAAIEAFTGKVAAADEPVVLVYFAGHGVQLDGENYLLPVDVKVGSKEEIKERSLSLSDILARLDRTGGRLQVVVLDSCRDNPFEDRSRGLRRGLASAPEKLGKLVAFSTAPGSVAADGDTGTSPYASALAEAVAIPGLTLEEVFKRVRATVKERTGGKQEPWENSAVYGDFRFVEAPRAKPEEEADEIAFFEFASLADSQEAYRKYLTRFPDGLFANLARQKIDFMDKDFSYRRKSETFRIFSLQHPAGQPCGGVTLANAGDAEDRHLADQEIILLDIGFDYPDSACGDNAAYFDMMDAVAAGVYEPNIVWVSTFNQNYFRGSLSDRLDAAVLRDAFAEYDQAIFGYRGFEGGRGGGEIFVYVRRPTPEARAYLRIAACEGTCFTLKALVRVHVTPAEETTFYHFEPVSAAELGLTWKYQNTLARDKELGEARTARLSEEIPVEDGAAAKDAASANAYRTARTVAGWDVVAIVAEDNRLRNCRAVRPQRGAKLAFFRLYPGGALSFGYYDPAANLDPAQAGRAAYAVDGRSGGEVEVKTYSPQELAYDLGADAATLDRLKAGREIAAADERTSLAGSRAMLDALQDCVTAFGG